MTAETLSSWMQKLIFSLERVAVRLKSKTSGSLDFSKKILGAQKCYVCVAKLIAAANKSDKFKFSSKGLNKLNLEDSRRIVLDEEVNLTSTNRGFITINLMFATYEQTKKGLSYFYPKRHVQGDGVHKKPLQLKRTHAM